MATHHRVAAVAAVTAMTLAPVAHADDGRWATFAVGSGEKVNALRVGAAWQVDCCAWLREIAAVPLLAAHVEYLNSTGSQSANDVIWDAGLLGGVHWALDPASRWNPFIELGLGGTAVTHVKIGDRNLSTALLFQERLSAGIALDASGAYALAAYAEHRSNADIKGPNQGLTTYGLELRVAWP